MLPADGSSAASPTPPEASSLIFESVHLYAVPRQVAGLREGLSAGGAGVGADAGMDANVVLQVAGL